MSDAEEQVGARRQISVMVEDFVTRKGTKAKLAKLLGYKGRQTIVNRLKFHDWTKEDYVTMLKEKIVDEVAIDW